MDRSSRALALSAGRAELVCAVARNWGLRNRTLLRQCGIRRCMVRSFPETPCPALALNHGMPALECSRGARAVAQPYPPDVSTALLLWGYAALHVSLDPGASRPQVQATDCCSPISGFVPDAQPPGGLLWMEFRAHVFKGADRSRRRRWGEFGCARRLSLVQPALSLIWPSAVKPPAQASTSQLVSRGRHRRAEARSSRSAPSPPPRAQRFPRMDPRKFGPCPPLCTRATSS